MLESVLLKLQGYLVEEVCVFFHCVSLSFSNSYVTGATSGAGTVTLLEPPNSHPYFSEVRVAKSLVFRVVFLSNIA
jgi:hypothetical protein